MKNLKLKISGKKKDFKSINGEGEIIFEKGKLKTLELDEILGGPVRGSIKDQGTYVDNLNFKAKINQGKIEADNFTFAGRFYTFKGSGSYSVDDGFNVRGNAVYLEKTLSELAGPIKILGKLIGSLVKVQIPIKIKGPAEDPEVEADLSRVLSILSPGRAVQSIGEGVGDILGGIKDVVTGE